MVTSLHFSPPLGNRTRTENRFQPVSLNPPKKHPREYQSQALREIERISRTRDDLLLWGATGTGKTLTQCAFAIDKALRGEQVVIAMSIAALPSQFVGTLADLGWPLDRIGFIADGREERPNAPIVIVMIGTLANRPHLLGSLKPRWVICDEAHETYFDRTIAALRDDHWCKSKWVWATATPWRLNPREAFTRIQADAVIRLVGSLRQIIGDGHLVPMRILAEGGIDDPSALELTASDGLREADAKKLKTPEFLTKAARLLNEHGGDRYRAAGLCTDIEQAELMADTWQELYPDRGVVILHSKIPKGEWHDRMTAWQQGESWLMLSVGQVLTGFDWPPLDCLAWLRPTSSRNLWVQGVGRALRLADSKRDALILDLVGNVLRVGHPLRIADHPPQLEPSKKKPGDPPEKKCPDCGEICNNFAAVCPSCGFHFTDGQLELDGGIDAPFGEVPDPILAKAINAARGQLKSAYTRWCNSRDRGNRDKTISGLIEQFPAEYQSGNLYRWLLGAVFRGDRSDTARCEFLRYLHSLNPIAPPGWVAHHFSLEFGFRLTDHSEISGTRLLGVPPNSDAEAIASAYRSANKDCFDPATAQLLRWAYDRAIEAVGGAK